MDNNNNNKNFSHDAELICKWIRYHVPRYDDQLRDDNELYMKIPSPSNIPKDVGKATNVIENALSFLHLDDKYDYECLGSSENADGSSIHFFKIISIEGNPAEEGRGTVIEEGRTMLFDRILREEVS